MKLNLIIRRSVAGVACMSFMLGAAAMGAGNDAKKDPAKKWQSAPTRKVIYVEVTGSRIPQRVVIHGQQVNSASPLFVLAGDEVNRSGGTSVGAMLRIDPSISVLPHK